VLCIVCSEEQFYKLPIDDRGTLGPLTNGILEMVCVELKLDHYYINPGRTVLVRVNVETLENPILKDW